MSRVLSHVKNVRCEIRVNKLCIILDHVGIENPSKVLYPYCCMENDRY